VALSLVSGFVAGNAAAGTRVVVRGNSAFNADDVVALARAGGWEPGRGTEGLSALQEAYLREGYLRASFHVGPVEATARNGADSTVTLAVNEGDVARFGRVGVKGLKAREPGVVLEALGARRGEKFIPREFDRRIDRLLESYDEQGFPFAQVWIDSLEMEPEQDVVHLSLYVVEGRERQIETVDVEGAARTKPDVVVRMSGLEPGQPYRGDMLRDAYFRLKGSGVFSDVQYPKLRVSPDGHGVDAVLVVDEAPRSNSFSGVLGYAAEEETGNKQVSGLVQLRMNNIGGTLKDLHVFWSNDGHGRRDIRLKFQDRFFLGRMFTAGATLEQVGQDTLFTWQSVGIEAGRPAGRLGRNLIGFGIGFHADRNVFSNGSLLRSWRYRTSGSVSLTRGDVRRNTFGDIETRLTLARKRSYFRDDAESLGVNQYIVEINAEGSAGLSERLSLYLGLSYRGLESDEPLVPVSEQFYIGGARTLRGYRENQFHGRRAGFSRAEMRLGSTSRENLYLFFDTGYVLQESPAAPEADLVLRNDLLKYGYGFGLRTHSQVGVIGLSFGFGDEVSLGRAKVHILLEQNF
jgi:outer membrane protein assembly factor BamA